MIIYTLYGSENLHLKFARIALREFRKRFLYMLIVQGKDKRKHALVSYCTIYIYINQSMTYQQHWTNWNVHYNRPCTDNQQPEGSNLQKVHPNLLWYYFCNKTKQGSSKQPCSGELTLLSLICHVVAWVKERFPHSLKSVAGEWTGPEVIRVGEIALTLTGCSAWECSPASGQPLELAQLLEGKWASPDAVRATELIQYPCP